MAGSDTARGLNFQYACTIRLILDFPLHLDWQTIQMEGDEDIEDVTIFDEGNHIVFRAQIKQKRDPHQWRPSELRDVFLALSKCPDTDATEYQFIYAGSEGETVVNKLKPILLKIQFEGWQTLTTPEVKTLRDSFGEEVIGFLSRIDGRFTLLKLESWKSIEAQDLRRLRKLLAKARLPHVDEDYEQIIYNEIFLEIAERTEGETKYFRQLTRDKIYRLLQLDKSVSAQSELYIPRYIQFLEVLVQEWTPLIPLTLEEEVTLPSILSLVARVEDESVLAESRERALRSDTVLSLHDVVKYHNQIVLVGEPGSGKTVSLWQLALHQCKRLEKASLKASESNPIPVIVDLAGYDGEPIAELVRRSFDTAGQAITNNAINDLVQQGHLILLFDDFDAAKTHHLPDLLLSLKYWSASHRKCSIVITTRRPSDGHNFGLPTFRLQPLNRQQAREILVDLPGIEPVDASAIIESLHADSLHLTTSPLTLRMMAYYYIHSDHKVPQSRAPLYHEVIKGILALGEKKGAVEFDRSDKVNLLALLARWMQDNETYLVSLARLSALIKGWIEDSDGYFQFAHLQACDQLSLRTELIRSGLLRITRDGDVEFIHSTFRAYLAALTIQSHEAPSILGMNSWRTSLILWVSLSERYVVDSILDLLVEHPVLLGQVINERAERRARKLLSQAELQAYFESLYLLFCEFVRKFPVLLHNSPWNSLTQNRLSLTVTQLSSRGYVLVWQSSKDSIASVTRATDADLHELLQNINTKFPLPMWLLPQDVVQKYHPLEVIYLWVMRSLFDLLEFAGLEGGVDIMTFGQGQPNSHPAVALIINRFLLYQDLVSELPEEFCEQLPFYAYKEYDLGIEVHEYLDPAIVRYAVMPAHRSGRISVVPSVILEPNDTSLLFTRNEDGSWNFRVGEILRKISSLEEMNLGRLLTESPGFIATNWLQTDLKKYLPGFPPQPW